MQFEVFAVSARGDRGLVEELNRFLRGHRVLHVERQLVTEGGVSFWSFCVEYLDAMGLAPGLPGAGPKVDYKELLTPEQFARFVRLRTLRKELADKEAVPPYAVFTNEQLAQIVRLEAPSATAMAGIPGIGQAKMAKYGEAFLRALSEGQTKAGHEADGQTAGTNR